VRYFGGKHKIRREIGGYINEFRLLHSPSPESLAPYWEPFVGSGSILERVVGGRRYGSDAHGYLIKMWQALQDDWEPPARVSVAMYKAAISAARGESQSEYKFSDADIGYIGFAYSFGGKWLGGYARQKAGSDEVGYHPAQATLKKAGAIGKDVTFFQADFLSGVKPPEEAMVIYCDPPYESSCGYSTGVFTHRLFWNKVRELEACGHLVLVSEYQAPDDFSCVLKITMMTNLNDKEGKKIRRVEKLFRLGDHLILQPGLEF
jgi:DNA adenine methylase